MPPSLEGSRSLGLSALVTQSADGSGAAGLAQRRAGKLLPKQVQPDIQRLASSTPEKRQAGL